MNIKIQCSCGARYSFDVEPVNGQMPAEIHCPACNASGVEQANAEISRQQASSPEPAPSARMRVSVAAAPTPSPEEAAKPQSAPEDNFCSRHHNEPPTSACFVCGKPICLKCMKQFGYLCSLLCRQKADLEGIAIPVCPQQQTTKDSRSRNSSKRLFRSMLALIFACLGFWIWYTCFGRKPKAVYSVVIPEVITPRGEARKPFDYYRLIAPNQLLSLKDEKLTLFDVTKKAEIWSAALTKPVRKHPAKARGIKGKFTLATLLKSISYTSGEFDSEGPNLAVTTNALWLWFPDRLYRFDRSSGGVTTPITNEIANVAHGENVLLVASEEPSGRKLLTRISLPDGSMRSEEISPAPAQTEVPGNATPSQTSVRLSPKSVKAKAPPAVMPVALKKADEPSDDESDWAFEESAKQYVPDGESVVQFQSELLEENEVEHVTVNTAKPKKSIIDSEGVTAGQGMEAAAQMAAPADFVQYEDLSRYRVTVRRRFCSEVPGWTNEVIGKPNFFPLKTVDIVTAGTHIYALDKSNKKVWEAQTSHPIGTRYSPRDNEHSPCVEIRDGLYIADAGTLARYDQATGNVLWHVDTVGVSHIQEDLHGALYVTTTTANIDLLKSSKPGSSHKAYPVILKIAPETGQILWRSEHYADDCLLSGKFVFSVRRDKIVEYLSLEDGPKTAFTLGLIDPDTGKTIWRYYQYNRHPHKIEVQGNWILAYFEEKMVVLKFFSL